MNSKGVKEISGLNFSFRDFKEFISKKIEEETGDDPDNFRVRLPRKAIEEMSEGMDSIDMEEQYEEMILITWEKE